MNGTVTHMAPELLSNSDASPAADVYAFGIMSKFRLVAPGSLPIMCPNQELYSLCTPESPAALRLCACCHTLQALAGAGHSTLACSKAADVHMQFSRGYP